MAEPANRMDELTLRFSRFFIRHRHVNALIIGALTAFFGYKALQLQVFSQFIDLLPRNHSFIQVYEKYNRQFGSANIVTAAIVAREGTLYDERVLEKVYGFSDQIDKVHGVDHDQVSSITSIRIRDQQVDDEGILRSSQIVGEEAIALLEAQFFTRRALRRAAELEDPVPDQLAGLRRLVAERKAALAEELEPSAALRLEKLEDRELAERIEALREEAAELEFLALRLEELPDDYRLEGDQLVGPEGTLVPQRLMESLPDRVHQNKQVFGRLVSLDDSAALVIAGFLEGRLDYEQIFEAIYDLKAELEADGLVEIHLTGQPVLVGWTFYYTPEILLILGLSLMVLLVLLGIYFRHWYGIVMPFTGAAVSAIWGLGFISIMGYQLEPLVLVIPMLITARAISHSVQFVERFYEEYERLEDKEEAVITSMAELLLPGTLAIVTDAFGIFVIGVSSIFLMKKVAIFGAFWALSIAVTEMLLNRLMIVYFPAPRKFDHYTPAPVQTFLSGVARLATGKRSSRLIVAVWLALLVLCGSVAVRVGVGESRPGTPILWPESEFNLSAQVISSKFFGADDLVVIVETEQPVGVHRPEVMAEIEAFQRYMEQDPMVGGSISIVDFLKAINRTFHNGDPRWYAIPSTDQEIGGLLYLYEAGSPDPRVLNPYRDQEAQNAAVRLFYADHQGDTIRRAVSRAEGYIRGRPTGRVAMRLETREDDLLANVLWWLGPLAPPRESELVVQVRGDDGVYARMDVDGPDRREPPPEDSTEWLLTLPRTSKELVRSLEESGFDSVEKIANADLEALAAVEGFDLVTAYALQQAAELDRRHYTVTQEWQSEGIHAQVRRRGLYEADELWVRYRGGDWTRRESGTWSEGASYALASGLMGVLGASNDEVEASNNATLLAAFMTVFVVVLLSYRSFSIGLLLVSSLGTAALISLAYMWFARIGFDVNTLPVQALGVGVGVDYALYIMDRVVHERRRGLDMQGAIETAIRTTGMAVFFTGSTLVGGIIFWYFISSLRFAADMSLLLSILLVANMFGAILLVPALITVFRPRFTVAVGADENVRASRAPAGSESEGP
jgi:predicted RND superfamily exporter protein